MPVHDARKFINSISVNPELRKALNGADNTAEVDLLLGENGFKFDAVQFMEAWSSEAAKSPTKERHDELNEIRMWWEMLTRFRA